MFLHAHAKVARGQDLDVALLDPLAEVGRERGDHGQEQAEQKLRIFQISSRSAEVASAHQTARA